MGNESSSQMIKLLRRVLVDKCKKYFVPCRVQSNYCTVAYKTWWPLGVLFGWQLYQRESSIHLQLSETTKTDLLSKENNDTWKGFDHNIIQFLHDLSFLKHKRELERLKHINVLCVLEDKKDSHDMLSFLVESEQHANQFAVTNDTTIVKQGETSFLLLPIRSIQYTEEARKQLQQIKLLLRGLATWQLAATDGLQKMHRFSIFGNFLTYLHHQLSETAHAVIIYAPRNVNIHLIRRIIQLAMEEGIPLLVISDEISTLDFPKSVEERLRHLSIQMKRTLIKRLLFKEPIVHFLHPLAGQNIFYFLFQVFVMGIYYWWKAKSLGYHVGFQDGMETWYQRNIQASPSYSCKEAMQLQSLEWLPMDKNRNDNENRYLLEQIRNVFFLQGNEWLLYKSFLRILVLDEAAWLLPSLLSDKGPNIDEKTEKERKELEEDTIQSNELLNPLENRLYFQDDISIWTLSTDELVKTSRWHEILSCGKDWGLLGVHSKPFQSLLTIFSSLFGSFCQTSILSSRWQPILTMNVAWKPWKRNICNFLTGIDGVILPIDSSTALSTCKYHSILLECIRNDIPVFFVNVEQPNHKHPVLSEQLLAQIKMATIHRILKLQQNQHMTSHSQLFLWLYSWRYHAAYQKGFEDAWKKQLGLKSREHTKSIIIY